MALADNYELSYLGKPLWYRCKDCGHIARLLKSQARWGPECEECSSENIDFHLERLDARIAEDEDGHGFEKSQSWEDFTRKRKDADEH